MQTAAVPCCAGSRRHTSGLRSRRSFPAGAPGSVESESGPEASLMTTDPAIEPNEPFGWVSFSSEQLENLGASPNSLISRSVVSRATATACPPASGNNAFAKTLPMTSLISSIAVSPNRSCLKGN